MAKLKITKNDLVNLIKEEIGNINPSTGNPDVNDKYSELDMIAREIVNEISGTLFSKINDKTKRVQSLMPYKTQYVLEKILEIYEKEYV
jgi:hypothetical protein